MNDEIIEPDGGGASPELPKSTKVEDMEPE